MAYTGLSKVNKPALGYDIGDVVICPCSWAGTTSVGAMATTSFRGDILSGVSYAATGLYTVTLRDVGYEILSIASHITSTAASTNGWTLETGVPNTTAGTVVVRCYTNDAAGAPTADERIHLTLFLRKTGVARER